MTILMQRLTTHWQNLKKNKLIANAGVYVFGSLLEKASMFFLIPLWARFLSPEDYGITGTLTAYAGVFTTILAMGLHGAVVRQYYDYAEDLKRQQSYITSVMLFQAVIAGLAALVLNIEGPIFWTYFTANTIPFDPYVRLALWSAYLGLLIQIPLALYQAQQKAKEYVAAQYTKFLLIIIGNFILVVFLRWGAAGVLWSQLLAGLITAMIIVYLALKQWFTTCLQWHYVKSALVYSLPLVPHLMATWVLGASDRIILERYVSLNELGLYNFGYMLGMAMLFLVTGINQAWNPYYFNLMKTKANPEKQIIQVVSIYVTLIGGICLIGVLFSKEFIYLLMPPIYYESVSYIAPVLLGYMFMGFYFFASMALHYHKKTKIIPLITIVAALLNIGLNFLCIPIFGAIAAAWTTSLTYGCLFSVYYVIGQKHQRIDYPLLQYGSIVIMIVIATIGISWLNHFEVWIFVIKLCYVLVYTLSCLFFIKQSQYLSGEAIVC